MTKRALPTLLLVTALAAAGCSKESPEQAAPDSPSADVRCDYQEDGMPAAKEVEPPPEQPEADGEVAATIVVGQGKLRATLDAAGAPCTVSSFSSLAEQGYFDNTSCHRLTVPPSTIFVLQCGDPTATGTGGPGYTIPDELDGAEALEPGPQQETVVYPAGTLAMANTGSPNSGGSQFFIVYADSPLPPLYTVFGTIDPASMKLVEQVAEAGTKGDGQTPAQAVTISSVNLG